MNLISIVIINFIVVFSKAQNQSSHSFIQPFLNQRPKTIAVCNLAMDDQIHEEIFEMSANFPSWVNFWDCIESGIPQAHESLIILNEITAKNLQKVFSKSNIQNSISYNTWLIHISGTLQDAYSLFDDIKLKIGINARVFIVQSSKSSKVAIQVIGTGRKKVDFKELGPIETANINDALKEVLVKKDFEGIELKANFGDNYFPYSFLNENGALSGILYDVLNIASRTLNVSLKYQDPLPHNYDIWSKRLKLNLLNGSKSTTYIGMLSEVSSGYVDASIGGFSTSLERFQLVEFSQSLVTSTLTMITKTPAKSDKVSYITHFTDLSWLSTTILIIILILSFSILFFALKKSNVECNGKSSGAKVFAISSSTNLCLRAFLKMAPEDNLSSLTYRIILFSTLFCGYITFSHYEALFASTLIVESEVLPYKSWDDVAKSNKLLFVTKGTINEDMFINAPSDHPMRKIYDEKIKVVPPDLVLNKIGKKGSVPYIRSGEYLAFSNARSYKKLKQFPCEIAVLDSASEITVEDPLVVPFTKESPFLIPFKKTFSMMRRVGVLTDIFKNYQSNEVKQCSAGMISFGFKHLKTPILILLIGLLLSIIIGLMERFIGSKLKMRKNDVEILEQPHNEVRTYILAYFIDNGVDSRNNQIKELRAFLDGSLKLTQETDKNHKISDL